MSVARKYRFTPEEYLRLERDAPFKSEYFGGEIFAMAGASPAHNAITLNIGSELRSQLRGGPCQAFVGDLRVQVPETDLYTYPDVTVVCGKPKFDHRDPNTLTNPTLLVEVLSRSTAGYDRSERFGSYRQLESLREYLLVAQDRPRVERFARQADGAWIPMVAEGLQAQLSLPSIDAVLLLAEVYDKVDFGATEPPTAG
jgi:Uma2 family endonuclease